MEKLYEGFAFMIPIEEKLDIAGHRANAMVGPEAGELDRVTYHHGSIDSFRDVTQSRPCRTFGFIRFPPRNLSHGTGVLAVGE